ncbi:MAG: peptidoglycan DD-metalloendopeptidase family protein [Crocinitomicaceae bacterium]|nr:peptidoglycan DD-metalloendopeptidase family protein [Crocinitomicaceae bacterium]
MESANRLIVVAILLWAGFSFGQTSSDKLKKEQARLENKIDDTRMLLRKSKDNTKSSLNELKVIENQISFREQLLKNYDNQIRSAELKVETKEDQIATYKAKVERLKEQYKKLILFAYKNRSKYGKLMFIFSSKSYFEAMKRNNYLKRIAEVQRNQFITIKQHQDLIGQEIGSIKKEKQLKLAVISDKKEERAAIELDRLKQEGIYKEFKKEEEEILAQLRKVQRDRQIMKVQIASAIRREIAAAEAKRLALEAAARKKNETTASTEATTKVETITFKETAKATALSKSFEGNRGKLPWPVDKGSVTEKFGKNAHPTLKNVTTNNRGIDISTPKKAHVKSVFQGEVTSVLNIPGAGKVVIIKHGNYRTVYSNLQDTYVKAGDKVKTKDLIGSLLTKPGQSMSVVHFEIHKVSGNNVTCLNPSLWVAQ